MPFFEVFQEKRRRILLVSNSINVMTVESGRKILERIVFEIFPFRNSSNALSFRLVLGYHIFLGFFRGFLNCWMFSNLNCFEALGTVRVI